MARSKSSKDSKSNGQESDRLPFEPKSSKKKSAKAPAIPNTKAKTGTKTKSRASREGGIPAIVSKRMAKRMAIFCGVPTLTGLAILPVSYFLITKDIVPLPNTAVLLLSLLCLGLGVVGLSYGVISASWDESEAGSLLGIQEFQLNFKRLRESWQARQ